jgi:hypothetical protein
MRLSAPVRAKEPHRGLIIGAEIRLSAPGGAATGVSERSRAPRVGRQAAVAFSPFGVTTNQLPSAPFWPAVASEPSSSRLR